MPEGIDIALTNTKGWDGLMALGDLFQTLKKPHSILSDVDRYLLKLQGKPFLSMESDREQGVWHPSEVSTVECLRHLTYRWLKTPKSNEDKIRPQIRRLFDVGHHFGYQIQGYFWDMGVLLGKWHCIECKHKWMDMDNPSPRKCPNCGTNLTIWYNLRYDEVPIRINRGDKPPVAGHADGAIIDDKASTGKRLLEIKTIKSAERNWTDQMMSGRDYFQKLNEPLLKHNYQLNVYMEGTGIPDGVFFYVNKNDQSMKEYMVKKFQPFIDKQFLKMTLVERALDEQYLPERYSNDKKCSECLYCPFKTLCHDTDHDFKSVDHRKKEGELIANN